MKATDFSKILRQKWTKNGNF